MPNFGRLKLLWRYAMRIVSVRFGVVLHDERFYGRGGEFGEEFCCWTQKP